MLLPERLSLSKVVILIANIVAVSLVLIGELLNCIHADNLDKESDAAFFRDVEAEQNEIRFTRHYLANQRFASSR